MNYLTKDDMAKVLRSAYKHSTRDHLILLMGFAHALRRSEIAALTVKDVENGLVRVKRVKNSLATEQEYLVSDDVLFNEEVALARWMEERPASDSDALFPSSHGGHMTGRQIYNIARAYMLAAGIPEELAHTHSLKHSVCAHLIRSGVGLEHVKQFAGHKAISSTIQYLHISDSEAMQKAQGALH